MYDTFKSKNLGTKMTEEKSDLKLSSFPQNEKVFHKKRWSSQIQNYYHNGKQRKTSSCYQTATEEEFLFLHPEHPKQF